jgi:glutamine amidotransferase
VFAFFANDLRRWTLGRRKFDLVATVAGDSRAECEQRFFSEWLKQSEARSRRTYGKSPSGLLARWRRRRRAEIVIIDCGSGNLHSAAKAFERIAADGDRRRLVKVTNRPEDILHADRIVLPGVGAFADCMQGLTSIPGMVEALEDAVRKQGKAFLGICVGMQLMATRGLEHRETQGLGWIAGEVRAIEPRNHALKIPHMGWNTLELVKPHELLGGITLGRDGAHAYFVHSYQFVPTDRGDLVATTDYGGAVTAMVARGNLAGTQFHPEKSQKLGLALIGNFLRWKP